MACYYPIRAFKSPVMLGGKKIGTEIIFDERKGDAVNELRLPCGECDGCRLERARQWAVRCMHEASLYEHNCFITLTYNDANLPDYGSLHYPDFQKFMKRLRRRYPCRKIRFFMCGEYGEENLRPHYHCCLFNFDFFDKKYFKTTASGSKIYTSESLQRLWSDGKDNPLGFTTIGDVNFDSAGYVARYVLKKRTRGTVNDLHYQTIDYDTGEPVRKEKEFIRMSLRNGIGTGFFEKWKTDIYPQDYVIVNGKKTRPPTFYSKKLKIDNKELYDTLQEEHCIRACDKWEDNTPDRLAVKEQVQKAQIRFLKRNL